ncbi:MAG: POTRA domain-containing protein, partial [Pyrinomonadaceae bacterium]
MAIGIPFLRKISVGAAEGAPLRAGFFRCVLFLFLLFGCFSVSSSQNKYEKHRISKVEINITGVTGSSPLHEQYRVLVRDAVGPIYSTPRIRDAINDLYSTRLIDTVTVAAALDATDSVELTFNIKRKTVAERVSVVVGEAVGDPVREEELLIRLNLLTPGNVITEQTLRENADEILVYLRDRGFYQSAVTYERHALQNENDVGVVFRVTPNVQATVESFDINILGMPKPVPPGSLKLKVGQEFSRERLLADVAKVRGALRNEKFIAPQLDEPGITYDSDKNTIAIVLKGKAGPTVDVIVETPQETISERVQNNLLPIKREGTLDYSAIVEGARRLENYYQERGYFFAKVMPACSVKPPLTDLENNLIPNETEFLCSYLSGEDLTRRNVEVAYRVELDRRFRVAEIRLRGTNKLTIEDVRTVLRSKEASLLGIVPLFGLGRGITSAAILEEDGATIKSIMSELGYPNAEVRVNRGVTVNGEDLIITFEVEEGIPRVVSSVSFVGNKAVSSAELEALLPPLTRRNYSRARTRNAARKIAEYYSTRGYYDARVTPSVIGPTAGSGAGQEEVKVEFRIDNEGKKVIINRLLVTGNEKTKPSAILKAATLRNGELLTSADVYTSEQNLYGTDAFSRITITPRPVGDTPIGEQLRDVVINVEEQPPRLLTYGGGFSTDLGLSGFFDIRHVNLFGNLWQGGARARASQRQQLVQFDFINPRFIKDGKKRYAPLTLSVQYQRDTTVTRFFRSAFDRGTMGIVQRVDEEGNAVDEFGAPAGSPTINRFAITAETSRTISRRKRSIFFLKYRYEDVRLFNIDSLLIKALLLPDARTRISGFSTTFVRDTRENCSVKYSLLDLISKGDQTDPCRYSASDPTRGQYITADYNVSLPALGANIGFQKFQASYNFYYSFPKLKNTTVAARGILGLGHVFSGGTRFNSAKFPALNGLLPISERFFAGGANT